MRLESYAQELEDLILYSVLRDVKNGFYIDVGANDPTDISVTKFFYDRGWHGSRISDEPSRTFPAGEPHAAIHGFGRKDLLYQQRYA